MGTSRKVREEEDDHSDGGEGGVGWPLGHSSQVRRDWDNTSLVSRTDTCVSKIYWAEQFSRWLHGAWQLTWPAWRCEPCLEYKQLQRHENEGNRGSGSLLQKVGVLWCWFFFYNHKSVLLDSAYFLRTCCTQPWCGHNSLSQNKPCPASGNQPRKYNSSPAASHYLMPVWMSPAGQSKFTFRGRQQLFQAALQPSPGSRLNIILILPYVRFDFAEQWICLRPAM